MSISRFRNVITDATRDNRLDLVEAKKIVEAAGTTVSTLEARAIKELFERITTVRTVQSPQVYATSGALAHMGAFLKAVALPVGPNAAAMREELLRAFEHADLGTPLQRAPATGTLMGLELRDARPVDGTRDTAFISTARREVYLRVDGGGRANPGERWYGPFKLDALPSGNVRALRSGDMAPATLNTLRENLRQALSGGAEFNADKLPAGRLVRVGDLLADRRGVFTVYVPERASLDETTRYVVKRTLDGVESFSGMLRVTALPDPDTDGRLSPRMRTQARNTWFRLERSETWNFRDQGPARSRKLVFVDLGGSVPTGAFVVGRNADGTPRDPDTSRELWFRAADGRWSGPHEIEPVGA